MKKLLFALTSSLLIMSCNSNDSFDENNSGSENTNNPETEVYVNNARVNPRTSTRAGGAEIIDVQRTSYTWTSPIDIFKHFPEFKTPEGYYDNVLFVSNGQPFDLVMLYSNGGYRHTMGIYWYENGQMFEKELWNELDDIANKTWVNFNGADSKGEISRKSDDAGAFTITLPKGTKYGFYCHSKYNGEEIKQSIPTPLPDGTPTDYNYKFYSEKEKNWTYNVVSFYKDMYKDKPATQAMSTTANGWTIVGFEDVAITYPSCDRDYNDCVFAINPAQILDGQDVPDDPVTKEVEVDIHQQVHNTWNETKTSVHVRDVTDVTIEIPIEFADVCPSDDFAVRAFDYVKEISVKGGEMQWQTLTTTVEHQTNKVVIKITGITQSLLDAHNGEITIEVHNYFTTDEIWNRLAKSTVKLSNPAVGIKGQIHYKDGMPDDPDKWIKF